MSESPLLNEATATAQHERRSSPRFLCKYIIFCQVTHGASSRFHGGYTVNISEGGCLLRTNTPFEVGEQLYLALHRSQGQVEAHTVRIQHVQQDEETEDWLLGCAWLSPLTDKEVSSLVAAFQQWSASESK